MTAPGLRSNAAAYDDLYLDGLKVPGIWHCNEIGAGYKLKQPKGSGDDGGEPRITGLDVSKGTIEVDLRTDQDEEQWEALLRRVRPLDKASGRNAVAVANPQFARHGITAIVVIHASEPKVVAGGPTRARLSWSSSKYKPGKTAKAGAAAVRGNDGSRPGDVFSRPNPPPSDLVMLNGGR